MTRFRYPDGWTTKREPGKRPDLTGTWLDPKRRLDTHSTRYWAKIHWATPPWLSDEDFEIIRSMYENANPKFEHVDHIVPLKNDLVCGLNVPWNMQVISIKENLGKSNFWWPDCPNHLCPEFNATMDLFPSHTDQPRQLRLAL